MCLAPNQRAAVGEEAEDVAEPVCGWGVVTGSSFTSTFVLALLAQKYKYCSGRRGGGGRASACVRVAVRVARGDNATSTDAAPRLHQLTSFTSTNEPEQSLKRAFTVCGCWARGQCGKSVDAAPRFVLLDLLVQEYKY